MWEFMNSCVILENMIVVSGREEPWLMINHLIIMGPLAELDQVPAEIAAFLATRQEIRYAQAHTHLQNDLVEHMWERRGNAT
jgi:hypothetical protein